MSVSRIAFAVALATTPLAAQQVEDPAEIVRRLGHEDFAVRAAAQERLLALGAAARPALEEAARADDPEVRARAAELLGHLDRAVPVEAILEAARLRRLRLVRLGGDARTMGELVAGIERATGIVVAGADPSAEIPPHPAGSEVSLREALWPTGWDIVPREPERLTFHEEGSIGCILTPRDGAFTLRRRDPADPEVVAMPGGAWTFARRPWPEGKDIEGWLFETRACVDLDGSIEWRTSGISAPAGPARFEVCPEHGPEFVYVPGRNLGPSRVAVEGIRRWNADVAVEIVDPVPRVEREIGGWIVRVEWPHLVIVPPRGTPESVVNGALRYGDVRVELRTDARPLATPASEHPFRGRSANVPPCPDWCPLRGRPGPGRALWRARTREHRLPVSQEYAEYPLEAIHRIAFDFHLPVEEPFTVESELLAPAER